METNEPTQSVEHHYRGYPLDLLRSMKLKPNETPTDEEVTAMMRKLLPEGFISAKVMPEGIQVYSSCPMPELE